jgi:hypothetical protein
LIVVAVFYMKGCVSKRQNRFHADFCHIRYVYPVNKCMT